MKESKRGQRKGKKVLKVIGIVLGSLLVIAITGVLIQCGHGGKYYAADETFSHIDTGTSFGHMIDHPVLKDYGTYVEDDDVLNSMRFLSLNSMSHWLGWDAETIVDSMNFVIDKANSNELSYLDFYSEQERTEDPDKDTTKLVFLQGEPNAPFALVIPGGGFVSVATTQEGFPYAQKLCEEGYNVFVLKHRIGPRMENPPYDDYIDMAMNDLDATLHYIFDHAEELKISTGNYSMWGSSAGGCMISLFCSSDSEYSYSSFGIEAPAATMMAYPAILHELTHSKEEPPTFIVVGENDGMVSIPPIDEYVQKLNDAGIAVEYTKFTNFPHGSGVGVGTDGEGWIDKAIAFWKQY